MSFLRNVIQDDEKRGPKTPSWVASKDQSYRKNKRNIPEIGETVRALRGEVTPFYLCLTEFGVKTPYSALACLTFEHEAWTHVTFFHNRRTHCKKGKKEKHNMN